MKTQNSLSQELPGARLHAGRHKSVTWTWKSLTNIFCDALNSTRTVFLDACSAIYLLMTTFGVFAVRRMRYVP